jgi:hypothetical protein
MTHFLAIYFVVFVPSKGGRGSLNELDGLQGRRLPARGGHLNLP